MKRFFVYILFSLPLLAIADEHCQIKPTLKQYTTINLSAELMVGSFKFDVPSITSVALSDASIVYFNKDQSMIYHLMTSETLEGNKPDESLKKALGLTATNNNDYEFIKELKLGLSIACDNPITEIKLNNDKYRAFMYKAKLSSSTEYTNVLIFTKSIDLVYYLQFKGFTQNEVGQIITTIKSRSE